jgi:hypothetical protein
MEGQEVHIEKGTPVFDAQQPLQPAAKRIGGHDNREGGQRICRLERLDLLDKGQFKVGMERTGNDAQHRESLFVNRKSQDDPHIHVERLTNNDSRNYPVSGPSSSPLQSTQHQSPSIKAMGSPQMPHSGAGPLSIIGSSGSSNSSSSGDIQSILTRLTEVSSSVVALFQRSAEAAPR